MPSSVLPRRKLLISGVVSAFVLPTLSIASPQLPQVEIWKTPTCGCCKEWVSHLERSGFKTVVHDVNDTAPIRAKKGIPVALGSCHTAEVGGYALEGHVPASEIKRLLSERPQAIGLAVPGMPMGSPGMEGPAGADHPPPKYDILLVSKSGKPSVYKSYR